MMLDWRPKIRAFINFCLADRIYSYEQTFIYGSYCDLKTKSEILLCPLTCSVNKSASVGYPWKSGNEKLRRGKDKSKPQNPKRSAFEMQSSYLTQMKESRPWYKEVSGEVLQQALRNLDKAFQNFFSGRAKYPRFKRTSDINFEFKSGTVRINGNRITFPVLGTMKFFQSRQLPSGWEIRTCTVSGEPDGFYVSVLLRDDAVPDIPQKHDSEIVTVLGIDVGRAKIASLSDGEMVSNPQFLKKHQRRLAIRQRRLSRKKKGSLNRAKACIRVAKVHQKTRRQREDFQWKLAKKIAVRADVIAFEDLNIKGMIKRCLPKKDEKSGKYLRNGQTAKAGLNKAISDASWYSLRQKTEYQALKIGNRVVLVDPRHTSQECSKCHYQSSTNRDKEKFLCEQCGHKSDADIDGAVTIAQRAVQSLGIASLRAVSPKVMPKPESTGCKEISLPPKVGSLGILKRSSGINSGVFDLNQEWETG